jgi:hypothetical protein
MQETRRVRHDVADAVALMAFSLVTSVGLASVIALVGSLG